MLPFESQRTVGEPVTAEHLPLITALQTDPSYSMLQWPPPTPGHAAAQLAAQMRHWTTRGFGTWAWFAKATGEFVGHGGLLTEFVEGRQEVQLTYCVARPFWGRGLATELGYAALVWGHLYSNLRTVVAATRPDDWRARRVLQKLEMEYDRDVTLSGSHQVLYRRRLV